MFIGITTLTNRRARSIEKCPHPTYYHSILIHISIKIIEEEWDKQDKKTLNRDNLLVWFPKPKNLIKTKPHITIAILWVRGHTT